MVLVVSLKKGANGSILVITDKDIIGKKFEEGKLQLDLTNDFYFGDEKSKEEIILMIKSARDVFVTGKEAVALVVELDLVDTSRIIYVDGVAHAQIALS
jgi:hypothetical protein